MTKTYEDQVLEQIEQYRDTEQMHDLPEVFHKWSSDYISPGLRTVFGVSDINGFYVEAFLSALKARRGSDAAGAVFLSLGCGDGAIEIDIARTLVARGIERFRFVCFDLSEVLLDRFRAATPSELAGRFVLVSGDLNAASFETTFDAIMANHSLHHIVDLESVFRTAYSSLAQHGVFVTSDMIGRNGHMRWPETRLFVEFLWPFLTKHQRRNVLLQRDEARFIDHNCATEGFEGVRAQDVLPLLLAQGFHPGRFFGFGGVVDVFVDRCFGPNFDVNDPDDMFLAGRIGFLNEVLLDAGLVKPTMMLAWFTKRPGPEIFYRTRTALASIRAADRDPAWLAAASNDLLLAPDNPDYVFGGRGQVVPKDAKEIEATMQAELKGFQQRIAALENSNSWRLTAPLRAIARRLRRGHQAAGRS